MFSECISSTLMTSNFDAREYFREKIISRDTYNGDISFLSTLRAMLMDRIPSNEHISLIIHDQYIKESLISGQNVASSMSNIFSKYDTSGNVLYIRNISVNDEIADKAISFVDENFIRVYGNSWTKVPAISELYRKVFGCVCFVNPSIKSTIVFTENLNYRKFHYLQCSLLGMLPWYYSQDNGITDIEKELIFSLREKTSEKYYDVIKRIYYSKDFSEERIKKQLDSFEIKHANKQIDSITNTITSIRNDIKTYNDTISRLIAEINEKNIILLGLKQSINEGNRDSELMKYFLRNKSLYLVGTDNSAITFAVKGVLSYFDQDIARRAIDNDSSFVYEYCERYNIEKSLMREFMKRVFIDQDLQIKFCAAYRININSGCVGIDGFDFPYEFEDYYPNTHIQRYSCLGNYGPQMNNLIIDGKYIETIELCIASSRSLNFGDYTVMSSFISGLINSSKKCIILPDSREVCFSDAIEWIMNNPEKEESIDV